MKKDKFTFIELLANLVSDPFPVNQHPRWHTTRDWIYYNKCRYNEGEGVVPDVKHENNHPESTQKLIPIIQSWQFAISIKIYTKIQSNMNKFQ